MGRRVSGQEQAALGAEAGAKLSAVGGSAMALTIGGSTLMAHEGWVRALTTLRGVVTVTVLTPRPPGVQTTSGRTGDCASGIVPPPPHASLPVLGLLPPQLFETDREAPCF